MKDSRCTKSRTLCASRSVSAVGRVERGYRLRDGEDRGPQLFVNRREERGPLLVLGVDRSAGEAGRYNVIYGYWEERGGLAAGGPQPVVFLMSSVSFFSRSAAVFRKDAAQEFRQRIAVAAILSY